MGVADSAFIFGRITTPPGKWSCHLDINGYAVDIHADGGFLAFLPVVPGMFTFRLRARVAGEGDLAEVLLEDSVTVLVPEPLAPAPRDSLVIIGEHYTPPGDLVLAAADRLEVAIRATPGCRAWFAVEGVDDSIPMGETAPRIQPYWGESVFGAGSVPDSLMVAGIYSGFLEITPLMKAKTAKIRYWLAPPSLADLLQQLMLCPFDGSAGRPAAFLAPDDEYRISRPASFRVSINSSDYPITVRFTDSVQTIRHDPRMGYFAIYQPEGVEALAVAAAGEWYKLRLAVSQYAWAHMGSVRPLRKGVMPPRSYLASIRFANDGGSLLFSFPLSGKHPFRVIEEDRRALRLQLFGVTSNTDWIRYDFSDELVDLATWSQPEPGLYEFKLLLTADIWGYDTYYRGNTFFLEIKKAPPRVGRLKGKKVVVDPGHCKDSGALGPTGLTEADANLAIALVLRDELEDEGAVVFMTRCDTSDVPLYDRPAIAKAAGADLYVSVHNNALPDGVNPFENNGTSTYYYHPHSIDLARRVHAELLEELKLPDHGLYHANFAVTRPTQYPAILVECAFMMIPQQEALLKTPNFRKKIAEAVTDGIKQFLKEYERGNRE